jgi:hypothetical protein
MREKESLKISTFARPSGRKMKTIGLVARGAGRNTRKE